MKVEKDGVLYAIKTPTGYFLTSRNPYHQALRHRH